MTQEDWNPGKLLETSGYYWKTCTLHAGVKLNVFTVIGENQLPGEEIAQAIGADTRGMTMLLNALSAMKLLKKTDETYANTQASLAYLSKASPKYIGHMIMHHHHLVEAWANMDRAVVEGKSLRDRSSHGDEETRESFLMGMFNIAMANAPNVAKALDLSGRKCLLDLGGGPGTYAIHF